MVNNFAGKKLTQEKLVQIDCRYFDNRDNYQFNQPYVDIHN